MGILPMVTMRVIDNTGYPYTVYGYEEHEYSVGEGKARFSWEQGDIPSLREAKRLAILYTIQGRAHVRVMRGQMLQEPTLLESIPWRIKEWKDGIFGGI